ncbi:hypothetical protein Bbelb_092830 [Branchiostoma belcheri]|nr:hypothetical protein Bbelb_092830 [Branchiostoma belcheri]
MYHIDNPNSNRPFAEATATAGLEPTAAHDLVSQRCLVLGQDRSPLDYAQYETQCRTATPDRTCSEVCDTTVTPQGESHILLTVVKKVIIAANFNRVGKTELFI